MNDDTSELKALRQIVWRTAISGRLKRFSEVLENPELSSKYFGEPFVDRLAARIDRLGRVVFLLAFAYGVLMLSLLASQDTKKAEFEIFGYGFKNLGYFKEILLLLAASISPVSAALSAYQRYLGELRKKALEKIVPDAGAREFYTYAHVDNVLDPLVKPSYNPNFASHGFTKLVVAAFGLVLLLLLLALLGASFVLQLVVIYDVASNPALSKYVNLFVVAFALTSIVLSWLIALLQLPLPEVDFSNLQRLQRLKNENQAKYEEITRLMYVESRRNERLWSAVVSVVCFVVTFSVVASFVYPLALQEIGALLAYAFAGAVLTVVVVHAVVFNLNRAIFRRFFRRFPAESEERLVVFARLSRLILVIRITMPLAVSLLYAFATLRQV